MLKTGIYQPTTTFSTVTLC